eukprot:CAMPEP_0185773032 /NCGR_PEP_ID=MMETSP1174-20130828/72249_1 /TAXON_ID=35687 /ORGANISM="Dictyocha speculum, Strain CCMP1381" /LENGTH=383 /DNA_ID=CAMNT_0028459567 /DNA_START=18 /DNA_END=1169 /DNA_ORIENTATION=+
MASIEAKRQNGNAARNIIRQFKKEKESIGYKACEDSNDERGTPNDSISKSNQWSKWRGPIACVKEITSDIHNFNLREFKAWAHENIEWTRGSCLWQIWKDTQTESIYPEMYFGAWVETFIIMLLMSWITTAIWNQDVIETNRIKDVMGYNNVCVGFDEVPARYVSLPGMVAMSYFGIRYVTLDSWRAKLQLSHHDIDKKEYFISRYSNVLFATTMLFWPMLLLITPGGESSWHLEWHFYIYVFFVVLSMCNIGANFFEAPEVTVYSQLWLILFSLDTFLLLTVGAYAFNSYDYEQCPNSLAASEIRTSEINLLCEQDPRVPVGFLMFLDYAWFVFLGMTPLFLPDAPVICLNATLGSNAVRVKTDTPSPISEGESSVDANSML